MDSPSLLRKIDQVAITIHDVARATAFYCDTLGLPLLFEVPGMAFFDCGGVRLMLAKPSAPEFDHPGSVLYFNVADLTAAHARLRERGVSFRTESHLVAKLPTHELWMAFFTDSEGNTLALSEERR